MRLLVVEDDLGVASLIQETLEAEGYALDRAESGSEATGLLQSFPYDLVLLDVMLPGQDGFAVLADLRQHKNRIPVLMLNGRFDFFFPVDTSQQPMFETLGTPKTQKRHLLYDTSHGIPRLEMIRETLDWLDRYQPAPNAASVPR